jgi:hypothetical protein
MADPKMTAPEAVVEEIKLRSPALSHVQASARAVQYQAALAAAGYEIRPAGEAVGGEPVAWFWREKATGQVGACTSEKHRTDTAASANYVVFPVFEHPAPDTLHGPTVKALTAMAQELFAERIRTLIRSVPADGPAVEAAYREGWSDGVATCQLRDRDVRSSDESNDWNASDAKRALTRTTPAPAVGDVTGEAE